MALRHRHKARSWHWMRRELPFWNPSLGTFGRIIDEMAETHRRSTEEVMRSLVIESMSHEPSRGHYDKIWFDEAADFPPIAFDTVQKRINNNSVGISSNGEVHFDGMVLPISDLKFHTK
jgi:hypothetical protein